MANDNPILVVGVDEDDFNILVHACERANIPNKLIRLKDGNEGLDYLTRQKEKPFIVLTEIYMPGMSGIAFRKAIEANPDLKSKSVPFIFLSEFLPAGQVNEVYSMSVQGLFEKHNTLDKVSRMMTVIYDYWQMCRHPDINS